MAVQTVTYTSELLPEAVGTWERYHTLPYFDPDLGNLISVNFTASLNATIDGGAENTAPDGGVEDAYIAANADMYVDMINGDRLTLQVHLATAPKDLTKYDNTLDYGGTSGFSDSDEGDTWGSIYYDDANKNDYIDEGAFNLKAYATAESTVVGGGNWASFINTYSWSNASITYTYEDLPCRPCISGYKFDECTDQGIADWEIILINTSSGTEVGRTTTNLAGYYEFCDLMPGTYSLVETLKDGWKAVSAPGIVTLDCDNITDQNFVNAPPMCINGTKINNCTNEGIPGWKITLKYLNGTAIRTTATDSNGRYSFCNLNAGTYLVCEEQKKGWISVPDDHGTSMGAITPNGGIGASCITNPNCIQVTLDCGSSENNNFKNIPNSLCINGTKINNDTGKGIQGWTITLLNSKGYKIRTAYTDANGRYSFCGLPSGVYTICEEIKEGWIPVTYTSQSMSNSASGCIQPPPNCVGGNCKSCIQVVLECNNSNDINFLNVPKREKACETFWANWNGKGKCLIPYCSSNWGWYLKPSIADLKSGINSEIWAAAGQCKLNKGYNVGKVTVKLDNTEKIVTLHFNLTGANDDCDLDEWHLWISDSSLCPHRGFSKWIKGTAEDIEIDLGRKLTDKNKDGVFVAVHGVACCDKCGTGECTFH